MKIGGYKFYELCNTIFFATTIKFANLFKPFQKGPRFGGKNSFNSLPC